MSASASPAERAAVDALLGPPPATDGDGGPGRSERGRPQQAREERQLLLPALHAVQDAIGWISAGALGYVCERLRVPPAEAYGVAESYALLSTRERPPRVAHLCDDIVCRNAGADALAEEVGRALEGDEGATWEPSPCLGVCERAPAALLQIAGGEDRVLAPASAPAVLGGLRGEATADASDGGRGRLGTADRRAPRGRAAAAGPRRPRRPGQPRRLPRERRLRGAASRARARAAVGDRRADRLEAARARRRGVPAGRKWADVASAEARPRYVVCNADESEPGTFKDRVLMEHDPFALIEAMTIAGVSTGAERGYLYIRREYPLATARLEAAIVQAEAQGLLGDDVMGSGLRFAIEIRRGAGAYICGEETALFNSIEGYRAEPRSKPPYPTQAGLFGKPTLVNNVETLANVPAILLEGGAAFAATGTEDSTGAKLFCLAGSVARPGVYEAPFGATLGDLIALAGGVIGGGEPSAVLLGGAAGSFVTAAQLDLPLTSRTRGARASRSARAR